MRLLWGLKMKGLSRRVGPFCVFKKGRYGLYLVLVLRQGLEGGASKGSARDTQAHCVAEQQSELDSMCWRIVLLTANKDLIVVEQQEYLNPFVLASSLVVETPNDCVPCMRLATSLQTLLTSA